MAMGKPQRIMAPAIKTISSILMAHSIIGVLDAPLNKKLQRLTSCNYYLIPIVRVFPNSLNKDRACLKVSGTFVE